MCAMMLTWPYYCAGTAETSWDNTGDTGPDSGNSSSLLPFYTSGVNALFATINGAYQPVINMKVSCPCQLSCICQSSSTILLQTSSTILLQKNALFATSNGSYQPVINMKAGCPCQALHLTDSQYHIIAKDVIIVCCGVARGHVSSASESLCKHTHLLELCFWTFSLMQMTRVAVHTFVLKQHQI